MNTKILGNYGEDTAVNYLRAQGYEICARNFRVKGGEIDIIAKQNGMFIFVEVKTRRGFGGGSGAEAVNYHKQKRIVHTALVFLKKLGLAEDPPCRFDVIEVYTIGKSVNINHITDAFET